MIYATNKSMTDAEKKLAEVRISSTVDSFVPYLLIESTATEYSEAGP